MPVPSPADLKAIFGLAPKDAIAYLERKGFAITWNWHDVDAATHARAFTVAKATRLDILQDIRNALTDDLRKGGTLREFQNRLKPKLIEKGWWGKQIVVDGEGNAEKVQLGSPRRLQTIYQTNMQTAYMAGRHAAMLEATKTHPYWMYIAVNDQRTRRKHLIPNGKVFRWDDPIWQTIFPPNGYNCRCRIIALTAAEVKRRGLKIETSESNTTTKTVDMGIDKRTGEIRETEVTVLRTTDAAGKKVTFSPDPGFNGSPAQGHIMDDILFRKAQTALGDAGAITEVQQVLNNPLRKQAWDAFVDGSIKHGLPQRQTMGIGVMQPADIAYAQQRGANIQSAMLYVDDRQLIGKKALRHLTAGDALTAADWKRLPQQLVNAEQVLWDVKNKTLLYIVPATGDKATKVAVRFNRVGVAGKKVDDIATAFKVSVGNIQEGIKSGMYEVVRGG